MSSLNTKLNNQINDIQNGNYLFSPSAQQFIQYENIPSEPNKINNTSKSDTIKKKSKNNNMVNKNSLRDYKYSNVSRKKTNESFQNFFRSFSTSRKNLATEGNINKNTSKINNNIPKKPSTKRYYNALNTFKNSQHINRKTNSNSMKRNMNLNLNNLHNLEEYKNILSNATKRKKNSFNKTNQKMQEHLQTDYHKNQKSSNSYDNKVNIYNKTQTKNYFSHNQINTLGNLFTTDNSIYNNTDCNVINENNIRNDINRKYYNNRIYKDVNAINTAGFQLPVKPNVSPNNVNHIQSYFNNLYKKQNNKGNKENNTKSNKELQNKTNNIKFVEKNDIIEKNKELNDNNYYTYKNNFLINENGNNVISEKDNLKNKIINDVKNKYDGPEEIHFYYVKVLQNGKLMEKILGKNNFY